LKIDKKNIDLTFLTLLKTLEKEIKACNGIEANFSQEFLSLLISRNCKSLLDIQKFLDPKITDLKNPFIIHDMYKAVQIIRDAIATKKRILIYGDKDVDGQTSTSLLKHILKDYGLDAEYYIPSSEGYGLHKSVASILLAKNIDLLITVDCGITNVEEVAFIKKNNVSVVILDHHEVVGNLPNADAVVDPKIDVPEYLIDENTKILKNLAGCGVVFYFGWALNLSYAQYSGKNFVALDIETTGLSAKNDKIIELGAVILNNGLIAKTKKFQTFVNPKIEISKHITSINGITNQDVKNAPDITKALDDFCDFLKDCDAILVHNAKFDIEFLKAVGHKKLNEILSKISIIDTLELTRNLYPNQSHKLEELAKYFRLDAKLFHRALEDAEVTAKIYWNILIQKDFSISHYFKKYVIFSALGTISDIMPLVGDNRFIVKQGLFELQNSNIKSLKLLLADLVSDNEPVTAKFVAWNISPILNSAGRMGSPHLGVEYLCSIDEHEILNLKEQIMELNKDRKNIQARDQKTVEQILVIKHKNSIEIGNIELDADDMKIEIKKFLFVASSKLERNVTGIVANNLVKKYETISFVASNNEQEKETVGSVRAPKGYNIVDILEQCKEDLIRFGGHKLAGGFSLKTENLEKFEKNLQKILNKTMVESIDKIEFDLVLKQDEISQKFLKEIFLMEPFGEANPSPLILMQDIKFDDFGFIGARKEHFKGFLNTKEGLIEVIGWNMKDKLKNKLDAKTLTINFDFISNVEKNFYNGENKLRLNIIDIVKS
jgi:single-stranded-DNA-specific exonuclease